MRGAIASAPDGHRGATLLGRQDSRNKIAIASHKNRMLNMTGSGMAYHIDGKQHIHTLLRKDITTVFTAPFKLAQAHRPTIEIF